MPWSQYYTDSVGPFMQLRNDFSYGPFDSSITVNCDYPTTEAIKEILGITKNTTKEIKKMEAKKCDRCGKLYEKKFDKNDIQCVFKHEEPFFTGEEKNYSKEFIEDKKTHEVYIKRGNGDYIDMCPDCRKAFKTWFESADKEGKK